MITVVEARNYRNLCDVRVPLREFQVLVGKNGSGKSTLMDVVAFLGDFLSGDIEKALTVRSASPKDLLHHGRGERIEFALEACVPSSVVERLAGFDTLRYEVAVRVGEHAGHYGVEKESVMLTREAEYATRRTEERPTKPAEATGAALVAEAPVGERVIVGAGRDGRATFTPEIAAREAENRHEVTLDPGSSALAQVPPDAELFPAATWFRDYMLHEIHRIAFESHVLARPNPPTTAKDFAPDGSNVASIVAQFQKESPDRHQMWVEQLQVDWPDLVDISTTARPEDGWPYLVFKYRGGAKVPAWLVSRGLLRVAAYTLPTYLAYPSGTYLYDGPEHDIHPGSMQLIYDALRSLWDSQALVATQSMSLMSFLKPKDLICFARDDEGEIDIVWGPEHRYLKNWSSEFDIGSIVASGILG